MELNPSPRKFKPKPATEDATHSSLQGRRLGVPQIELACRKGEVKAVFACGINPGRDDHRADAWHSAATQPHRRAVAWMLPRGSGVMAQRNSGTHRQLSPARKAAFFAR